MQTIEDAFTDAVACHQRGDAAAAERLYRSVLASDPLHPAALNNLALLVPDEAVPLLRRAVSVEPRYVDAWVNLSNALYGRQDAQGATAALDAAAALLPAEPEKLFQLGRILHEAGRDKDAAAQYERAIALRPDFAPALCNLGVIHFRAEETAKAADCYRRALASDPATSSAALNLTGLLESEGRLTEAAKFRARVPRGRELMIDHAPDHRRTVLVLVHRTAGNTPLDTIIQPSTNTRIRWQVDFATAKQAASLPPFDVAFNAVANADLMDVSRAHIERLARRHKLLNPPDAVFRTRRDLLPARLRGIPGLVLPETIRVTRAELQKARPWTPPVLIRPIGGHGGEGARLLETAAQLEAFEPGTADAFYVIRFHDTRRADGFYRKYRMIFVDGVAYPYHLAISDHWLVHYFSAAMLEASWKREEEARFLDDPEAVLGPAAMAAITAVGQRLGLDYAGIDFTLLEDGRVLVFEANPAMLVHLRDDKALFPAKHRAVPRIFAAIEAMLDRHARAAQPHA